MTLSPNNSAAFFPKPTMSRNTLSAKEEEQQEEEEEERLTILQPIGYSSSSCGYCPNEKGTRSSNKSSKSYGYLPFHSIPNQRIFTNIAILAFSQLLGSCDELPGAFRSDSHEPFRTSLGRTLIGFGIGIKNRPMWICLNWVGGGAANIFTSPTCHRLVAHSSQSGQLVDPTFTFVRAP